MVFKYWNKYWFQNWIFYCKFLPSDKCSLLTTEQKNYSINIKQAILPRSVLLSPFSVINEQPSSFKESIERNISRHLFNHQHTLHFQRKRLSFCHLFTLIHSGLCNQIGFIWSCVNSWLRLEFEYALVINIWKAKAITISISRYVRSDKPIKSGEISSSHAIPLCWTVGMNFLLWVSDNTFVRALNRNYFRRPRAV